MPPQVTETWASAYLQVLFGLLVFALGIPAIIFNKMDVPEEIRHIIHRRKRFTWCYILVLILVIASLSFIWLFHPCPTSPLFPWKNYISGGVVSLILILILWFWFYEFGSYNRENLVLLLQKKLKNKFNKQKKLDKECLDDLVYLGEQGNAGKDKEMVLNALDKFAADVQSTQGYKGVELEELIRGIERVVGNREKPGNDRNFSLAGNILKRIRLRAADKTNISYLDADLALQSLGRLGVMAIDRRSEAVAQGFLEAVTGNSRQVFEMGRAAFKSQYLLLAKDALSRLDTLAELNDLIDLGEQGNAGDEKEMVLKVLNRLAANVQGTKGYQGVELEELIRGIERVIANREKPGNDRNFSSAGEILKRIRQRANESRSPFYLDADLALKGLGRLGVMAIDRRSEAVAQGFLEALSGNSQKVFEMGKAALRAQYFLLALAALSRLETLAETPAPNDVNISALLGLVAYFRAAGSSARQRAELSLSQSPEIFTPSLPKCLQNAYDYYYSLADYETADQLLALMNTTGHTGMAPVLAGFIPKTSGKVRRKRYRDPRAGDRVNKSS